MRTIREWMARLIGTVIGRRSDRDLEQELQSHLELAAEDALRRGESAEQAVREARLRFGGVAQGMDAYRDRRGLPWLEDLVYDTRHAVRALRRAPAFTAVAVITLALGIGANTAIFSIVNSVLLRPLAYPRPEQLMYVSTDDGARSPFPVSVPEYLEFRQFATTFAEVGAFRLGEANLSAGDQPRRVRTANVDAPLMRALGVQPIDGRVLTDADTVVVGPTPRGAAAVAAPVALVSYGLWQSAFGGQPLVGRTIDVDGRRVQVVGVMPRAVDLMDDRTEVWLPLGFTENERQARDNHNLELIGRVKPEVGGAAAYTELDVLMESWRARTGITPGPGHEGHVFAPSGSARHVLIMTPLADQVLGRASRSIWVLQAAVGLVLFIACANVANLLLARAETRRRDVAVLKALGASRGRLLRKALVESVTLAVAGSALGIVLARLGVDALTRLFPLSLPRIGDVAIDLRVMLASLAVAVACGLLCGLAPLVHTRSDAIADRLTQRGSTGTSGRRVRGALVSVETAFAVIVAIGAGLLLRTVDNLTSVDAGFDRARLVTFSLRLPRASFDNLGRVRAYEQIIGVVRAVPGVRSVTGMTGLPLDRPTVVSQTEISNSTHPNARVAPLVYQRVMPNFVETIGLPMVQGRAFEVTDTVSAGGVAIVNETLVRVYWKGRNPIGQRLRPGGTEPWLTVIGVAKDVKQAGVDQPVFPEIYVLVDQLATDTLTSFLSISPTALHVVLRTTLPLASLAPALTRAVGEVNRDVPVAQLRDMGEVFTDSIRRPRLLAQVLTIFAGLALVLAAIGTYGVLSYMVAERRREVGIRLALGAERLRVLWQVMRYGLTLAGCGLIVGVAVAFGVTRFVASLLFGVEPADPATLLAVFMLLTAVALFACWLPAWRASRLDPNAVLRLE